MTYKHILLVEDDLDDQFIFQEALKIVAPASVCTVVNNGEQALEQLHVVNPDIIFSDINLPIINGIELLTAVCKLPSHIPIVMMSTSGYKKEILVQMGAKYFFVKPTVFKTLCQELTQLLY